MAAPMGGKINGGPNPIQGATITVWVTGAYSSTGPGGTLIGQAYTAGTAMQSVTSDSAGAFNFTGGYPCPAGQFLYLTSAGGHTLSNTTNNLAVLVAALGRCDDLYSGGKYTGPFIYMNELTTIAAAYALQGFATTSGQGSGATVSIGAPAAANASVGSTSATAALRHAFLNAATLTNVNNASASANFTAPANSSARVPAQLINSMANSLVACVNTSGASTACNTVFGSTGTSTSSGNTFGAMLNLARNPTMNGTGFSSNDFFSVSGAATNFYQPVLTSAPSDYSIAIRYPKGSGASAGVQGLQYPVSAIIDLNDNVYVGNNDGASPTKFNLASFTSNGAQTSFTPDAPTASLAQGLTVDAIGNLYRIDANNGTIVRYSVNETSGTITAAPTAVISTLGAAASYSAVDRKNNVWVVAGSVPYFGMIPAGSSAVGATYQIPAPGAQIAVDPNQNIWITDTSASSTSSNRLSILQNTGSAGTPVYPGSFVTSPALSGLQSDGIAFAQTGLTYAAYVTNQSAPGGITPFPTTISGATVTSVIEYGQVTSGLINPGTVRADGQGFMWIADGSRAVSVYDTGASSALRYEPCVPSSNSGNTTCASNPLAAVTDVEIDSTGSVWALSAGTGTLNQVIGAATPIYPLLSLGILSKP